MRILAGGQIIEDIDNYARCHELFSILTSTGSRINTASEGFSKQWDTRSHFNTHYDDLTYSGIKPGQSQKVAFKLLSGVLNQSNIYLFAIVP